MFSDIKFILMTCGLIGALLVACAENDSTSAGDGTGGGTGKGGSMARFAIDGDNLYAIAGSKITQFDISNPARPGLWDAIDVAFDIETLFPSGEYLFVGAETGVHIFAYNSLGQLEPVSSLLHVQSCDPVVVEGDLAYVTLRGTSGCSVDNVNQFQIIDLSDIRRPALLDTVEMQGPMGLGVDDHRVFICDGDAGLKVLDVTDPEHPERAEHLPGQVCYDVIPDDGILIVSGFDGLYQYDITGERMERLSRLAMAEGV